MLWIVSPHILHSATVTSKCKVKTFSRFPSTSLKQTRNLLTLKNDKEKYSETFTQTTLPPPDAFMPPAP